MLNLRRGRVTAVADADTRIARLTVTLEESGEPRAAIAYPGLTGPVEEGDDVVVNVEGYDLELGSGGFDIVHCNLTRGLAGKTRDAHVMKLNYTSLQHAVHPVEEGDDVVVNVEGHDLELGSGGFDIVHCNLTRGLAGKTRDAHVMKLNYTSLQHAVQPVEEGLAQAPERAGLPVAVLALHGQLPCVAFALAHLRSGTRVGFVQTPGGALAGELSDTVADLLQRGLLAGHVTAGACHGGQDEAITVEGALDAATRQLGWDCAIVGPGPGILGSSSALGHGGLAALANAHAAMSVGCPVVLVPRMSSGDERERHRGLSHHTETVMSMLLRPVHVAAPAGVSLPSGAGLERAIAHAAQHEAVRVDVSGLVEPYRSSGLPARTMGRSLDDDRDFFLAALAGGTVLAGTITDKEPLT